MKFASAKKLLEGLQTVQNVVSTRTTLPILSNVLLEAAKTACASPPPISMSASVARSSPQVEKARRHHTARAPACHHRARTACCEVHDRDGLQERRSTIRCGQSFFKILGLPEEEFPPLPTFEDAKTFTISQQSSARRPARKPRYAISTDETRYVLNGILFSFKENKLTMVATDGAASRSSTSRWNFRAARKATSSSRRSAVTELYRLLGEEGE